jgi:hypothetical protein
MSSNIFNLHILSNIFLTDCKLYQRMHILLYIFVIWLGYNMDQTFLMMDLWNPKPVEGLYMSNKSSITQLLMCIGGNTNESIMNHNGT